MEKMQLSMHEGGETVQGSTAPNPSPRRKALCYAICGLLALIGGFLVYPLNVDLFVMAVLGGLVTMFITPLDAWVRARQHS
jgi:hypothetical protein